MKRSIVKNQLGIYLLLSLYLCACNTQPDIDIPEEIASLENLTVVDPDSDPIQTGAPVRTAVYGDTEDVIIGALRFFETDHLGRVFIADGSLLVIHAYDPDGNYIGQVGSEGDGPGEFRRINSITFDDTYLHVMDTETLRISRFDLNTFEYVDARDLPFTPDFSGGYFSPPNSFDLLDNGNYLIHFSLGFVSGQEEEDENRNLTGRIMDLTINEIQEEFVYSLPANEALVRREGTSLYAMNVPYKRTSHIHYNNGQIFHGWSEELLFKWYDLTGSTLRSLYVPYNNVPLNRDEVVSEYADRDEPWRSMVRNDQMPETWPSFIEAFPDDEMRVWAGLYTDNPDSYTWQAYTIDGELYASFTWPRSKTLKAVRNGALYTIETDPDTDLRQVAKYRFQ